MKTITGTKAPISSGWYVRGSVRDIRSRCQGAVASVEGGGEQNRSSSGSQRRKSSYQITSIHPEASAPGAQQISFQRAETAGTQNYRVGKRIRIFIYLHVS